MQWLKYQFLKMIFLSLLLFSSHCDVLIDQHSNDDDVSGFLIDITDHDEAESSTTDCNNVKIISGSFLLFGRFLRNQEVDQVNASLASIQEVLKTCMISVYISSEAWTRTCFDSNSLNAEYLFSLPIGSSLLGEMGVLKVDMTTVQHVFLQQEHHFKVEDGVRQIDIIIPNLFDEKYSPRFENDTEPVENYNGKEMDVVDMEETHSVIKSPSSKKRASVEHALIPFIQIQPISMPELETCLNYDSVFLAVCTMEERPENYTGAVINIVKNAPTNLQTDIDVLRSLINIISSLLARFSKIVEQNPNLLYAIITFAVILSTVIVLSFFKNIYRSRQHLKPGLVDFSSLQCGDDGLLYLGEEENEILDSVVNRMRRGFANASGPASPSTSTLTQDSQMYNDIDDWVDSYQSKSWNRDVRGRLSRV